MTLENRATKEVSLLTNGYLISHEEAFIKGFKLALKLASGHVDADITVVSKEAQAALDSRGIDITDTNHFEVGISRQSILQLENSNKL